MTFAVDIGKFIARTQIKADVVLRRVALDAFSGVQRRSPVDTGRFRGSWRVGVRGLADTSVQPAGRDPEGHVAAGTVLALSKIKDARFGQTVFLTNNLPYARRLEAGHSRQAPNGVLGPTFSELRAKLDQVVRFL